MRLPQVESRRVSLRSQDHEELEQRDQQRQNEDDAKRECAFQFQQLSMQRAEE